MSDHEDTEDGHGEDAQVHPVAPLDGAGRRANLPVTIENGQSKPTPTPRVNLRTLEGVRVEMGRVYRQMKAGQIEGADGTKRAYVLSLIGKLIEVSELQARIEALEDSIGGR